MNHSFLSLSLLLLLSTSACRVAQKKALLTDSSTKGISLSPNDTLVIGIRAVDLSEDMSRLSTKDDEVLLLIYEGKDSLSLGRLLFSERFTLSRSSLNKEISFGGGQTLRDSKLVLFLIEQDADTPVGQIDTTIGKHYPSIVAAFRRKDYLGMERYLGDEDLLGIKTLHTLPKEPLKFNGVHKLDRFDYRLHIRKSGDFLQKAGK